MAPRTMIDGTGYDVAHGRALMDGTGYDASFGRTLIEGTGYDVLLEKFITELQVGDSVFLNVGGSPQEFLIVHHGLPGKDYDSSCDGAWLLMKDMYEKRAWDSTDSDYENSDIHAYLNGTFLSMLDSHIAAQVKQVKIPFYKGTGADGYEANKANGLDTKIFLLTNTEVGVTSGFFPTFGSKLDYFETGDTGNAKRVARLDGAAAEWWLRTPAYAEPHVWHIRTYGAATYQQPTTVYGVRPALILPSDSKVDGNNRVV